MVDNCLLCHTHAVWVSECVCVCVHIYYTLYCYDTHKHTHMDERLRAVIHVIPSVTMQ